MAEIKIPGAAPEKNDNKKDIKPKAKAVVKEKSFKQKVKEAIIADDVGDLKEYAVLKVLIPAAKKTVRSLLINMFDIRFFGKSLGTSEKRSSGGNIIDYSSKSSSIWADESDELQRLAEKKASNGVSLRISELSNVQFATEEEALNVLRALRGNIADYGLASVSDFLEQAGLKANTAHTKWGWYNLESARIEMDPDSEMYYIVFPRPKGI